jgi:cellulose synthase/poly-beta-1,6-N-acetylglucosamine synthase-like glycosyltransferase
MGYGSLVFILPCFNEAQNIGRLLAHLKQIAPELPFTSQITVVSDECSDETDSLVRKAAGQSRLPISLIQNPRRVGKVHGINQALKGAASCEWAVLISGDALPDSDCVAQLLSALVQPGVGIAAARPIPVGPPGNWVVRLTQLLFCLHHEIALRHPKSTEITAFRNEVGILPEDSLVDEAEIEWVLHEKGFRTIYVPEARIFTNAPTTFF